MGDVVYIDVLLLENFFMNYLLIYLLKRLCKYKTKEWKMILASLFGAFYVIFIFYPDFQFLYCLLMKFLMSIIMLIIAFTPRKIRDILKIVILFYIEAFIIGGSILAIFYLTYKEIDIASGTFLLTNISSNYIIIGILIAIILVKIGFDYLENFYGTEKNKIEIQIILDNKRCSITALIDTGNTLKDPVTNVPVIVVYQKSLLDIFPDELKKCIADDYDYESITKIIISSQLKSRIRIIPYRALGTENGILIAIRADMAIVKYKNKCNVIEEPIIALYNKPISVYGDYQALAYPEILK
ncbi:stage II sporulation protein GA (sporulation sigma-E factor processing peptidase) [Caloramator quimbayensis]|uniref:Sporulation sigma-E factor-processing peptidase n=1 Tax=Caloramator quimbayensis TaxID=1147123 RepID=A0A1T4X1M6_9CLOT|nr:sigma-E processing peptidase SpoIIGA [Caloramator quimbayensis]SKA83482.1 stage II sporulation protein GA (sporulation sigma-E factor processing peptidase) [Caloramator quimbayensis]